jgi:hypothetical protein
MFGFFTAISPVMSVLFIPLLGGYQPAVFLPL